MAKIGNPVIYPGPNNLLQFGHRTAHGIQTSIENFLSLLEARAFCKAQNIKVTYEIDGQRVNDRECDLISAMPFDKAIRVNEARTAIKSSVKWTLKAARRLKDLDLVRIYQDEGGDPKPGEYWIELLPKGHGLADLFRAPD